MSAHKRTHRVALAALLLAGSFAVSAAAQPVWKGHPPYGNDLMTRAERKAYWKEFLALPSDADRDAYYEVHVEKMKQRAVERGVSMPKPYRDRSKQPKRKPRFWRPPYFEEIMTEEEKEDYYPSLDAIPDALDRDRFVARHIRTMYARAQERGVSAPLTTEFDDVFEALGEDPPDLADRRQLPAPAEPPTASGEAEPETAEAPPVP